MKRFKIISDRYRNRRKRFGLRFNLIARREIKQIAKQDHPQEFFAYSFRQTRLFGAPPVDGRTQIKLVKDPRSPVERLAAEPECYIRKPSPTLASVIQKYQAVTRLQATLTHPLKPAPEQIQDFRQALLAQRSILEKSRDSAVITFLKGIATVLSLGLTWWAFGIWDVKGKAATKAKKSFKKNFNPYFILLKIYAAAHKKLAFLGQALDTKLKHTPVIMHFKGKDYVRVVPDSETGFTRGDGSEVPWQYAEMWHVR